MLERFSDQACRVVVRAREEARTLNHNWIGTEHLMLGLIGEGSGMAAQVLESLGINLEAARWLVEETIGRVELAPSATWTSRQ
jgi:ATP-dependent Clp protease ATP-binding subunit ClpC